MNGSAVVCGGQNSHYEPLNECYIVSKSNITSLTHLDTKRFYADSIAVNNTLWVLGGIDGGLWMMDALNSTE